MCLRICKPSQSIILLFQRFKMKNEATLSLQLLCKPMCIYGNRLQTLPLKSDTEVLFPFICPLLCTNIHLVGKQQDGIYGRQYDRRVRQHTVCFCTHLLWRHTDLCRRFTDNQHTLCSLILNSYFLPSVPYFLLIYTG